MSDRVPYIPPSMRSVIEEKTPEIPEWLKDNYPDWLDDYMLIYDVDHPISREQFEEFEKVHEDQIDRQLILPEIREFKHADSSRKNIEIVKKSLCAVENFAMDEINKFHRLKFKDKDEKEMIFKTMLRFRHNVSWTHFEWEHLKKLNDYINSKIDSPFIVDLYAGHGYIAKVFEYLGYLVKAYDDYSWTVNPIFTKVTKKSAVDAVEETFDTVQKEKNIIFMFIMPPGDDDDSAQKALMQILKNGKTHMGNIYVLCVSDFPGYDTLNKNEEPLISANPEFFNLLYSNGEYIDEYRLVDFLLQHSAFKNIYSSESQRCKLFKLK